VLDTQRVDCRARNKGETKRLRAGSNCSVTAIWELARSGNLHGALDASRKALQAAPALSERFVELQLVCAFCLIRQGKYLEASRALEIADRSASRMRAGHASALRVHAWRAELAYFQGRYSDASLLIDRVLTPLEQCNDLAYVAFALRIRIAILLARTDYDAIALLADRALRAAEASGDDYVIVQVLNVLGAARFDMATSKLGSPHARAHLTALDLRDAALMESDAREARRLFQIAYRVAKRSKYEFAAWYVAGNIERLDIILGNANRAVSAIRKRLDVLQDRGAKYDEIVTRSNLAWALRTLMRYREALHELDVALRLARDTGTCNVLLEFLEYDRSIVLYALGDATAARASYRRYLQLVGAAAPSTIQVPEAELSGVKRPLEPYVLKRADQFAQDHISERFTVSRMATYCGVSWRTLETTFANFRGLTPVAYVRNLRLDRAHAALNEGQGTVAAVAARFGFQSSTTFALAYRKRFGVAPSRTMRTARWITNSV
jgi:AraC-like DNA-binding protein